MELRPRQRLALEAICETFAPGSVAFGVIPAIEDALDANPRAGERRKLGLLLSIWDAPFVGSSSSTPFSSLPQEGRERALRGWRDSRLRDRRVAYSALRKAALGTRYLLDPGGTGYPGPVGPPADPPPRGIAPLAIGGDTMLECDVCVVGSGAGGGAAAGVLAAAGLDVVVLEEGGYYDDADFDGDEAAGYRRLFLESAAASTADQGVSLLAGRCLGGGTVVNWTTSFRTPDEVREEWAALGVPAFAGADFTRSLDAVCARIDVNVEHNVPSRRDVIMQRGLDALGWHVAVMPRNVRGCDPAECGACTVGCRIGAKRSTVKTWLADAAAAGARIVVGARAGRIVVEGGSACGVEARTAAGHRVSVRSRAVVAACGAIHTPGLLRRSGLSNKNIGSHLRLHPVTACFGDFDEEVRPWEGTLQALYSDELRDLGDGYGVKYETGPIHPGLAAAFLPWDGAARHAAVMDRLAHLGVIGVLTRDHGSGEVKVGRDGEPVAHYRISHRDARNVRAGVEGAARILAAAGATRISTTHADPVSAGPAEIDRLMAAADSRGWDAGRCAYYSFHLMGSVRMGGSPGTSACNPEGETWEVCDLVVCDGSTFPTASGVNPMVSIEAIAHLNASRLAARLS